MTITQRSYTKLENEFRHEFRSSISRSEDAIDLENHFGYIIAKMLNRAMGSNRVYSDDIILDHDGSSHFHFSERLLGVDEFNDLIRGSDMNHVVSRFADTAFHRWIHFQKHREKTEAKIRN